MLPPQLQGSLQAARRSSLTFARPTLAQASPLTLRATIASTQCRGFWGWRRQANEYTSHIDPLYNRFTRYRTLKTRAKLMEKLRRRGKFDWDISQRPFFSGHRWASHWNGRNGPKWNRYFPEEGEGKERRDVDEAARRAEEGGQYELSIKEREWKDQMEALRKRIERNPYEAVFGKRFEPFWTPLVPGWMREEIARQGRPEEGQMERPAQPSKTRKTDAQDGKVQPEDQARSRQKPGSPRAPQQTTEQAVANADAQPYASYRSTSWDSRSNTTKRTEWDSVSDQTRSFEYDPVSNRMVQVETARSETRPIEPVTVRTTIAVPTATLVPATRPTDMQSLVNTPSQQRSNTAQEIPVKTYKSEVASITAAQPSVAVAQPGAATRPAALSRLPKADIDLLTAENVRASMGKIKHTSVPAQRTPAEKAVLEKEFERQANTFENDIAGIFQELNLARNKKTEVKVAEWDKAENAYFLDWELDSLRNKKTKLLNDEHGLFHIERQKRQLAELDERIKHLQERVAVANASASVPAQDDKKQAGKSATSTRLQTSLDRGQTSKKPADSNAVLQPSIQRMQSKDLAELDDSAAHESTESLESINNVPKQWSTQADLLQSSRIERTSPKRSSPYPATRWIDDMNARRAAWEAGKPQPSAEETAKTEKLRKANEMLEAEIQEQKFRIQAHENRYAHKIRSLREELDRAYKQSAVHGEKHVERIRYLETEVEKISQKSHSTAKATEEKYIQKIHALRQELDIAYKQSAVHGEKHVERIRYLEKELATASKAAGETSGTSASTKTNPGADSGEMRGEGDFCANVTQFTGSAKWYKRPATGTAQPTVEEVQKAEQKLRDRALVKEVREIYEKQYGIIDTKHRQSQAREEGHEVRDAALATFKPRKETNTDQVVQAEHQSRDEALAKFKPRSTVRDVERKVAEHKDRDKALDKFRDSPKTMSAKDEVTDDKARDEALSRFKQPMSRAASRTAPKISSVDNDANLGDALAQHEKSQASAYAFKPDDLEAELKVQKHKVPEAEQSMQSDQGAERWRVVAENLKRSSGALAGPRLVHDTAPRLIPTALPSIATPAGPVQKDVIKNKTESPQVQWEAPPLYKVLAYDSGNDKFSTATTTSNFTGSEQAISIPQALSQLYQPARFVPYFAELQEGGYQVIFGTRDLLVFKKVKTSISRTKKNTAKEVHPKNDSMATIVDHGLIKPKENELAQEAALYYDQFPLKPKEYDPTSIENGKLVPYEATLAQEAAHAYDNNAAKKTRANPIDGTSSVMQEEDVDYVHYPRVRRTERHFTGLNRKWSDRHERHHRRRRRGGGGWGSKVRWALSVGAGAAVGTYVIGVAAEAGRREKRMEVWR